MTVWQGFLERQDCDKFRTTSPHTWEAHPDSHVNQAPSDMASPTTKQAARTILLISLDTLRELQDPSYLKSAIAQAAKGTSQQLRILVFSRLFDAQIGLHPSHHWDTLQVFLTFLYAEATAVAQEEKNILLNIEVILRDGDPEHSKGRMGHEDIQWNRVLAARCGMWFIVVYAQSQESLSRVTYRRSLSAHFPESEIQDASLLYLRAFACTIRS